LLFFNSKVVRLMLLAPQYPPIDRRAIVIDIAEAHATSKPLISTMANSRTFREKETLSIHSFTNESRLIMDNLPLIHRLDIDDLRFVANADPSPALALIREMLLRSGYAEQTAAQYPVLYSRGSQTARWLVGGLAGTCQFSLNAEMLGAQYMVKLASTASPMRDGAIGVSRSRKELQRLAAMIIPALGSIAASQAPPDALGNFADAMYPSRRSSAPEYAGMVLVAIVSAIIAFNAVTRR
jgi:hypothetical protein